MAKPFPIGINVACEMELCLEHGQQMINEGLMYESTTEQDPSARTEASRKPTYCMGKLKVMPSGIIADLAILSCSGKSTT